MNDALLLLAAHEEVSLERLHVEILLRLWLCWLYDGRAGRLLHELADLAGYELAVDWRLGRLPLDERTARVKRRYHRILGQLVLLVFNENKVLVSFKMKLEGFAERFSGAFAWQVRLRGEAHGACVRGGPAQVLDGWVRAGDRFLVGLGWDICAKFVRMSAVLHLHLFLNVIL